MNDGNNSCTAQLLLNDTHADNPLIVSAYASLACASCLTLSTNFSCCTDVTAAGISIAGAESDIPSLQQYQWVTRLCATAATLVQQWCNATMLITTAGAAPSSSTRPTTTRTMAPKVLSNRTTAPVAWRMNASHAPAVAKNATTTRSPSLAPAVPANRTAPVTPPVVVPPSTAPPPPLTSKAARPRTTTPARLLILLSTSITGLLVMNPLSTTY
jgi:hypothetical protein